MTGIVSAPLANAITTVVIWLACIALPILLAVLVRGDEARRLADLDRPDPSDARTDMALILTCDPCHGRPGRCWCPRKCEWELCGADDTGVDEFGRELDAWLDREGPQ